MKRWSLEYLWNLKGDESSVFENSDFEKNYGIVNSRLLNETTYIAGTSLCICKYK